MKSQHIYLMMFVKLLSNYIKSILLINNDFIIFHFLFINMPFIVNIQIKQVIKNIMIILDTSDSLLT